MQKISQFIWFSLIILLTSSSMLQAGPLKKYAGEFMYLGADGRGAAMGSAFTSLSQTATSVYWNPAGLVHVQGLQAQFMHSKRFINSIQQNYLALATKLSDDAAIGASFYYLTVNDIADTRRKIAYEDIKWFNTGDYIFTLSYAQKYYKNLEYGVNVKFIYRDLDIETATGIGFDAGIKYAVDKFKFGLMLRDITTTLLAWSTGTKEFVTPSARIGASYTHEIPSLNMVLVPAIDLNILAENRSFASQISAGPFSVDVLAGLEVNYNNLFALRAGMDDLNRFTAGAGLSLPKVTVDYAFTAYSSELGNIHRISFHLFLKSIL